VEYLIVALLKM